MKNMWLTIACWLYVVMTGSVFCADILNKLRYDDVHEVIMRDSRISLIRVVDQCYLLYSHSLGSARALALTKCPGVSKP